MPILLSDRAGKCLEDLDYHLSAAAWTLNGVVEWEAALPILLSDRAGECIEDLDHHLSAAARTLYSVVEWEAAVPILLSGRAGKCLEDLDYHLSAAARTLNGVVEWEVACPLEPVKPTCVHATGHGESHHANAGTPVELRLTHLAIALGLIGILLFGSGWMRKQDRLDHRGRAVLVLERELEREVPRRVSLLCGFRVRLQDQQRKFGRARGIPAGDV